MRISVWSSDVSLPISVDYPAAWNGGTMTTAGNLVFQGTSTGRFRAYAADTGKQLLDLDMQSGIVSAPSTFRVNGVQYVAFPTSKGGAFPLWPGGAGAGAVGRAAGGERGCESVEN